jgi:hypothetical protein
MARPSRPAAMSFKLHSGSRRTRSESLHDHHGMLVCDSTIKQVNRASGHGRFAPLTLSLSYSLRFALTSSSASASANNCPSTSFGTSESQAGLGTPRPAGRAVFSVYTSTMPVHIHGIYHVYVDHLHLHGIYVVVYPWIYHVYPSSGTLP